MSREAAAELEAQAAALQGATYLAAAFALSLALGFVPDALVLALSSDASVSTLVGVAIGGDVMLLALRIALFAFALRRATRPTRAVPWVLVLLAALAAVGGYPLAVGARAGVTMILAERGVEALAQWSQAIAWIEAVSGMAHALMAAGVLVAAAVLWHRRSRPRAL